MKAFRYHGSVRASAYLFLNLSSCLQALLNRAWHAWQLCVSLAWSCGALKASANLALQILQWWVEIERIGVWGRVFRAVLCFLASGQPFQLAGPVTVFWQPQACHWAIDELKATVPIWKKEFYEGGDVWKENAECRRSAAQQG